MPHTMRKESRPRWKTCLLGCGIGCGVGAVLLLAVGLILFGRMTAVPPSASPSSPAVGQASSGAQPSAQDQPPPFEAQAQQIEEAARSGQRENVSLRLNEAQINNLLAQNSQGNSPLQNPRVTLGSGDLTLTGTTYWRGRQVYVTITGQPQASGGRLSARVDSVRIGTLGAPGWVVANIQREIDAALADLPVNDQLEVSDVSIYNGELVASGVTRPR